MHQQASNDTTPELPSPPPNPDASHMRQAKIGQY